MTTDIPRQHPSMLCMEPRDGVYRDRVDERVQQIWISPTVMTPGWRVITSDYTNHPWWRKSIWVNRPSRGVLTLSITTAGKVEIGKNWHVWRMLNCQGNRKMNIVSATKMKWYRGLDAFLCGVRFFSVCIYYNLWVVESELQHYDVEFQVKKCQGYVRVCWLCYFWCKSLKGLLVLGYINSKIITRGDIF